MKEMKKQVTKRLLGMLVVLCMVLPILPMPINAADFCVNKIYIGERTLNSDLKFIVNGLASKTGELGKNGCTAQFDAATGTLSLQDYYGGSITAYNADGYHAALNVKLVGNNTVREVGETMVVGLSNNTGGEINIIAENDATLIFDLTSREHPVAAIKSLDISQKYSSNINIRGKANVTIYIKSPCQDWASFGLYTKQYVNITDDAKLSINVDSYFSTGISAKRDITFDTTGDVTINSLGASPRSTLIESAPGKIILKKAKTMTLESKASTPVPEVEYSAFDYMHKNTSTPGGNMKIVYGKPRYLTITEGSGTGKYLAGETVTITAIPKPNYKFDRWTSRNSVTYLEATSSNSSTAKIRMDDADKEINANWIYDPSYTGQELKDTTLKNISISLAKVGKPKFESTLNPPFNSATRDYTLVKGENYGLQGYITKQIEGQTVLVNIEGKNVAVVDKGDKVEIEPYSLEKEVSVVIVTVISKDGSTSNSYKVTISNQTALIGKVIISGKEQFGEFLTANVIDTNNTGTLTYKWTRSSDVGDFTIGKTYFIDSRFDAGNVITCEATSSVQTGSIRASTGVLPMLGGPAAPTGLGAVNPSSEGASDGKITGTTTDMEYSGSTDFMIAKDCRTPETTGLKAGTYYVRFKASGSYEASAHTTVNLGGFGLLINKGADGKIIVEAGKEFIDKAIDNAIDNNESAPNINIKVENPITEKGADVGISANGLASLARAGNASLSIDAGKASLRFDASAIRGIKAQSGNKDVVIHISLADKAKLNLNQKATVADNIAYELSIISDGKAITEFNGNVIVSLPYTPKAGENLEAIVIYYIDTKGGLQIVRNGAYDAKKGVVTFATNHFSHYMIKNKYVKFNDVADGFWGKPAIDFAAARGLVAGIGNNKYNPGRAITRAEFVQMMQNVLNLPAADSSVATYADVVKNKDWFYETVMSAKAVGLLKGIKLDGNKFLPNKAITREEMAAIMANTATYKKASVSSEIFDLTVFKDYKSINKDFYDAISISINLGLLNKGGTGGGNFSPKASVTRAAAAEIQRNLIKALNFAD